MMEDAPDGMKEFAHNGDDGLLGFLAAGKEGLVAGGDLRVVADGVATRLLRSEPQNGNLFP